MIAMPKNKGGTKGGSIYPWKKWFKKRKFTVEEGADYECMTHSMAQQIRNAAYRHRVHVSLTLHHNSIDVEVRPTST